MLKQETFSEGYGKGYELEDLEYWDRKIQEIAAKFELSCFPQEFEICDYEQMLGYLAYSGMPAHYPHWSFGKSFEKQKTLYDYGVSGLPYEMVINSNPALAYLMKDNTLALQILTIAHVYGHNDFFKNNKTFMHTRPEYTLEMFKSHGERIRSYIEDPSIGVNKVEIILDTAHALSLNCLRIPGIKKLTKQEQIENAKKRMFPPKNEFSNLQAKEEIPEIDLSKIPLEPEEDILLFIRDNNPYLQEWQKDILTIAAKETEYFIPQIETKIMNEGWATYWHYKILHKLFEQGDLPQGIFMEFITRHNQVIKPIIGGINPYYLGSELYKNIFKKSEKKEKGTGINEIFHARESCRDASFLRQYLTKEFMAEMNMLSFEKQKDKNEIVIQNISDEEGWKEVKEMILKNVGLSAAPVIKIEDADFKKNQILYLRHEFDGRELELSYAQQTLRHIQTLWQKTVVLESKLEEKPMFMACDGNETVKITYQLPF